MNNEQLLNMLRKATINLDALHGIEDTLSDTEKLVYGDTLLNMVGKELLDWSGVYYDGEQPSIDSDVLYNIVHAPASLRQKALAEVISIREMKSQRPLVRLIF